MTALGETAPPLPSPPLPSPPLPSPPLPSPPLRLCLVGAQGPEATGGLAAYGRGLAEGLSRTHRVSVAARFSRTDRSQNMYAGAETPRVIAHERYQTQIFAPRRAWRPLLARLGSLVSRPRLQPAALRAYRQAYQPALAAAIPPGTEVIHYIGTGWELLGYLALAEARRRGAALTIWPAVHPGTWGDSPLDVALYNGAQTVFAQSAFEQAHLIGRGVHPSRLCRCGLAPAASPAGDGQRFRQKHGLGTRPLALFIGRKDRGKGCHALREAMPRVLAAVPDACLVAIGPDCEPPYPAVPPAALRDLGEASEAEKADALAACDVFCLPSAHESFGIVYTEAWAYGKPVIGGPAPAVRELITEGVDGFCTAQEPGEIAGALLRLLRCPGQRRTMGEAGRARQQAEFTWDHVCRTHAETFRQVVSDQAPRRT